MYFVYILFPIRQLIEAFQNWFNLFLHKKYLSSENLKKSGNNIGKYNINGNAININTVKEQTTTILL